LSFGRSPVKNGLMRCYVALSCRKAAPRTRSELPLSTELELGRDAQLIGELGSLAAAHASQTVSACSRASASRPESGRRTTASANVDVAIAFTHMPVTHGRRHNLRLL
jgi:hypothetical protein